MQSYANCVCFVKRIGCVLSSGIGCRRRGRERAEDGRSSEVRARLCRPRRHDYMASELDRGRKSLDGFKRELLSGGKLDLLDDADRVVRKLQKAADQLRFASYGYAGFFDQVKIEEAELDKIYQYDGELLA